MTKFANEMENVDWEFIKKPIDDAQTAYSTFHNLLIEKYNSSFPLKILKKAYYTKKALAHSSTSGIYQNKKKQVVC